MASAHAPFLLVGHVADLHGILMYSHIPEQGAYHGKLKNALSLEKTNNTTFLLQLTKYKV